MKTEIGLELLPLPEYRGFTKHQKGHEDPFS